MSAHTRSIVTFLSCLAPAVLLVAACESSPPTDDFVSEGGTSPDPSAVLAGAVSYRGPRPYCRYKKGKPVAARGAVVLTLFEHDNPPPPEGTATTALSLATVSAARLFPDLRACLPESPTSDELAELVSATATFTWSGVPLSTSVSSEGKKLGASYRIHALFDRDGDFHPLFGVRNQPTRGDVAGAAYVDAHARQLEAARIDVGHLATHPNGQRVDGIVVDVREPVYTERPMFRVSRDAKPLSSESALPIGMLFGDLAPRTEAYKAALGDTDFKLELIPEQDRARYAPALDAAGLSLDYDPSGYSWHREGIDANRDGSVDDHPLLAGIPYSTPALFLERARTPAEVTAGVPPVIMLGASMDVGATEDALSLPMLVVPIGVMRLPRTSGVASCDVPMLPPDNIGVVFDGAGGSFECQELATGVYGLSVLQGVQGGATPQSSTASDRFDFPTEGVCLAGTGSACARNSYTAWSIPNDLGPPDSDYNQSAIDQLHSLAAPDEALWIDEQGPEGRYVVFDPRPSNDPKRGCDTHASPALACDCCASVAELCEQELPACKLDERGVAVIETDAAGKLTCLPFALPASCCDGTCVK